MTRVLGPIRSSWSLERAIADLLNPDRGLIGIYEDEINRQAGTPEVRIERPRSVKVRWAVERFAEDQLPAIVVINENIKDVARDGDGRYSATWVIGIAGIAQATDQDIARAVSCDLAMAAATVVLHALASTYEPVVSVTYAGEYKPLDLGDGTRSRCGFGHLLDVRVQDIVCDLSGLPDDWATPDPPMGEPAADPGDLLTVDSVDVTVTPVEVFA